MGRLGVWGLIAIGAVACSQPAGTGDAGTPDAAAPDAGNPADGGSGADAGGDGGFTVGAHAAYPQVPNQGGPILHNPRLVTITYDTDPGRALDEALGDWVFGSQWYQSWSGDYGVDAGTHFAKVHWPAPAPGTLDENSSGALVLGAVADGGLPAPDADTVYALFLPTSTTVSFFGGPACHREGNDFVAGFHWDAQGGGVHVAFTVVPSCVAGAITESPASVEYSATHELAEAATDPFPASAVAWQITDAASPWSALPGEVGDLCVGLRASEGIHTVQRIWSNRAAAAGAPCVPVPAGEDLGTTATPGTTQTLGAGQMATFTLQGWSLAPVGDWTLSTLIGGRGMTPTATLSAPTLNNGQTATLTVRIPATALSGSAGIVVVRSAVAGVDVDAWPVLLQVP